MSGYAERRKGSVRMALADLSYLSATSLDGFLSGELQGWKV